MKFKEYIINKLKNTNGKKKILFVDGNDQRAIEAVKLHDQDNIIEAIVLVEKNNDIPEGIKNYISMEQWSSKENILIEKYVERRQGKETLDQAKSAIKEKATFAMLMLELGEVDGVVGGLVDPTSVILRAAFKIIKPAEGIKTISSVMIMEKGEDWSIFSDISVNIEPSKDQLVDIAFNSVDFAKAIGFEIKPAFLSFSTDGSAVHPRSTIVKEATEEFNKKSYIKAIGEVQFDTAWVEKVREQKYSQESFKGKASILIFPSLEAGNIGYKIAQRLGGYGAVGPILTGIKKPVNDLSRGALVEDVYNTGNNNCFTNKIKNLMGFYFFIRV